MRLIDKLKKNKMALIVSLPRNSVGLARAAVYGGADAIKIHINIRHAASGQDFGNFDKEKPLLETIFKSSTVPVGIVPGAGSGMASLAEMKKLIEIGFDFLDVSHSYAPHWMFGLPDITKMIAVNGEFSADEIPLLEQKGADILEAAVVPEKGYGLKLLDKEIDIYRNLAKKTNLPIVVPTQKKIVLEDLPKLKEAGVKGIMIGIIVMGDEPATVEKTTLQFRKVIDDL
jgi:hypothetical protein